MLFRRNKASKASASDASTIESSAAGGTNASSKTAGNAARAAKTRQMMEERKRNKLEKKEKLAQIRREEVRDGRSVTSSDIASSKGDNASVGSSKKGRRGRARSLSLTRNRTKSRSQSLTKLNKKTKKGTIDPSPAPPTPSSTKGKRSNSKSKKNNGGSKSGNTHSTQPSEDPSGSRKANKTKDNKKKKKSNTDTKSHSSKDQRTSKKKKGEKSGKRSLFGRRKSTKHKSAGNDDDDSIISAPLPLVACSEDQDDPSLLTSPMFGEVNPGGPVAGETAVDLLKELRQRIAAQLEDLEDNDDALAPGSTKGSTHGAGSKSTDSKSFMMVGHGVHGTQPMTFDSGSYNVGVGNGSAMNGAVGLAAATGGPAAPATGNAFGYDLSAAITKDDDDLGMGGNTTQMDDNVSIADTISRLTVDFDVQTFVSNLVGSRPFYLYAQQQQQNPQANGYTGQVPTLMEKFSSFGSGRQGPAPSTIDELATHGTNANDDATWDPSKSISPIIEQMRRENNSVLSSMNDQQAQPRYTPVPSVTGGNSQVAGSHASGKDQKGKPTSSSLTPQSQQSEQQKQMDNAVQTSVASHRSESNPSQTKPQSKDPNAGEAKTSARTPASGTTAVPADAPAPALLKMSAQAAADRDTKAQVELNQSSSYTEPSGIFGAMLTICGGGDIMERERRRRQKARQAAAMAALTSHDQNNGSSHTRKLLLEQVEQLQQQVDTLASQRRRQDRSRKSRIFDCGLLYPDDDPYYFAASSSGSSGPVPSRRKHEKKGHHQHHHRHSSGRPNQQDRDYRESRDDNHQPRWGDDQRAGGYEARQPYPGPHPNFQPNVQMGYNIPPHMAASGHQAGFPALRPPIPSNMATRDAPPMQVFAKAGNTRQQQQVPWHNMNTNTKGPVPDEGTLVSALTPVAYVPPVAPNQPGVYF